MNQPVFPNYNEAATPLKVSPRRLNLSRLTGFCPQFVKYSRRLVFNLEEMSLITASRTRIRHPTEGPRPNC